MTEYVGSFKWFARLHPVWRFVACLVLIALWVRGLGFIMTMVHAYLDARELAGH